MVDKLDDAGSIEALGVRRMQHEWRTCVELPIPPVGEFSHGEADPDVLRFALKAVERDGYWWVQCSACDSGWQIPYVAESVG